MDPALATIAGSPRWTTPMSILPMHTLKHGLKLWYVLGYGILSFLTVIQMQGSDTATDTKPPNHRLFNAASGNGLGLPSALQHRQTQRLSRPSSASNAPVIHNNVQFPPELLAFMRPSQHAPAPSAHSTRLSATLLPPDRIAGPDMTINDFCSFYKLAPSVAEVLQQNGYLDTNTFEFMEVSQLQEFLNSGSVAQLRAAVSRWSTMRG